MARHTYSIYVSILHLYVVVGFMNPHKEVYSISESCGLNGFFENKTCICDAGWKGDHCHQINLLPVRAKFEKNELPGANIPNIPTWGGGAVFENDHWHLVVGSRAVNMHNNTLEGYPCDSQIIRVSSVGKDAQGPYVKKEIIFPRTSWEPSIARAPSGELVIMFFGNLTNPPDLNSAGCQNVHRNFDFNITTTGTYISISKSGSIFGPWETPIPVKGMENRPKEELDVGPFSWNCASSNPSPAFHPNGTLYAAVRHNPCWHGFTTREHIGLWRSDGLWNDSWHTVTSEPLFGWGGGSERNCSDENWCPSNEDPFLWWSERGAHILVHNQNNKDIHSTRGAYGWSIDGLRWTLETDIFASNESLWDMGIHWTNSSYTILARRQRPSLIRNERGRMTYLITGADLHHHKVPGNSGYCEGCHWGSGFTLIQQISP